MLKITVLCALLCLSTALVIPKGSRNKPNARVQYRKANRFATTYQHPFEDYALVAVATWVGQPAQLIDNAYIDTDKGDVYLKLCPNSHPADSDLPCYNSYKSQTFVRLNANQAMEVMKGDNADDKYMTNVTFITHCDFESRFGFGWPNNRVYADDTYYPSVYLNQKGVNNIFLMSIAKDGCVSQIDWGSACESSKYATNYVPVTSDKYWQFNLNSLTLGNVNVTFDTPAHPVITSMEPYIGMPKKVLNKLMAAHNITWSDEYGAYTAWCYGTMPDLKLQLQGLELTIKPEQYLYTWQPLDNGKCVVNFIASEDTSVGHDWYFGFPLFAAYCTTFDYDNAQIGFMYNDWYAQDNSCHS
uniref:Peptidase A1 domain-containing protein n=1 Tax=Steinernema glaseri TaxID=37863 RepID=A0A1I7YDG5_9BILA